jgi:hypothetical protein
MGQPSDKQDSNRLGILSTVMLSRMMPKIHSFYKSPITSVHGTEFHWNVIIGQIT